MDIVKVMYSKGSLGKNDGCENAPDILLESLHSKEVEIIKDNVDKTMRNISKIEGEVFVGGDHSITYGSFKGFSKKFSNPGIILFDAHPDLEVTSGSVTHEDYLRKLIEEGVLKKENVILVGIRKVSKNEKDFMNGMKFFGMEQIFNNEEDVCDSVMEMAREFDGLYLSIDIDVLDPAFAPGTGYREVSGLNSQQLFYFLRRIKKLNNLKRVDLVEINPEKDRDNLTINMGKKIIGEFV